MNWNKRVRSERRKSHFRGPRFQNFRTPLQIRDLMYASVSSGAGSAPGPVEIAAKNGFPDRILLYYKSESHRATLSDRVPQLNTRFPTNERNLHQAH